MLNLGTKIKDLADLRDEVAHWAPQTRRQFTPDELDAVVQYLNESHYRIGLPSQEGKAPRQGVSSGSRK